MGIYKCHEFLGKISNIPVRIYYNGPCVDKTVVCMKKYIQYIAYIQIHITKQKKHHFKMDFVCPVLSWYQPLK